MDENEVDEMVRRSMGLGQADEIRDIIRHSLGLGQADKPYRRHYCADPTPALTAAVERGLMTGPHDRSETVSPLWFVTEAGAESVGSTLPNNG